MELTVYKILRFLMVVAVVAFGTVSVFWAVLPSEWAADEGAHYSEE